MNIRLFSRAPGRAERGGTPTGRPCWRGALLSGARTPALPASR